MNWHVLSADMASNERDDSVASEMEDGLGGFLPFGADVREFIAAARRLKAQREARAR